MYRKNTAGQFFAFQGVDATTGGIKSGVTWTVRREIDGTFAAATGTVTEDGTAGWYKFAMSQADTNGNNVAFNFTGTGAVPQTVNIITDGSPPDVNLKNAAGTAVTLDSNNVLNVSAKYLAGTALTGRDIGASVLLSTGTGTGQLDFTSGVVKANLAQILGTALTETAGQIAAAFKKFFNIATPASTMDHLTLIDTVTTYTGNTPQTGDSYARLGAPAGASVSADVAAVKTDSAAIKTQTDKLTFTVANQIDANVLDWKSATAPAMTGDAYARLGAAGAGLTALGDTRLAHLDADVSTRLATSGYTAPDNADIATILSGVSATYSRLGTPAGASVSADIAAVKSDIDAGVTLSSSALDAIWAYAVDGTRSALGLMRGFAAALLGKASGLATTSAVFRDTNDTKDRITATVDVDGNRTSVTLDLT